MGNRLTGTTVAQGEVVQIALVASASHAFVASSTCGITVSRTRR
jgi:hypothetical protein